jgi:hypothetical protein
MLKYVLAVSLPFSLVAGSSYKVDTNSKNPKIAEMSSAEEALPRVSIVDAKGSVVSLTNGNAYAIDPESWDIVGGWIGNSPEVSIEDTKDGSDYPIILTNKATGSSVRAALIPKGSDTDASQMPSDLQPAESSGDTASPDGSTNQVPSGVSPSSKSSTGQAGSK